VQVKFPHHSLVDLIIKIQTLRAYYISGGFQLPRPGSAPRRSI